MYFLLNNKWSQKCSTYSFLSLQEYSKLSPLHSDSQWPQSRDRHSSTIITSVTDEEETHLMVIGGHDNGKTLADCWLFNIATRKWNKV